MIHNLGGTERAKVENMDDILKVCAYCGRAGTFTREHVFPSWLQKRVPPPEKNLQYFDRLRRFVDGDITIKDVCPECNNVLLSALDGYMAELYDSFLKYFVRSGQSVQFKYRFDYLARWLLKTAYNMARAGNSDIVDELSKCAEYILHGRQRPQGLAVFVRLIIPHRIDPADAHLLPESIKREGEIVPYMVRVAKDGNPVVAKYESMLAFYRIVAVNSYYFHLLVPKSGQYSRPDWRKVLRQFQDEIVPGSFRLSEGRQNIRLSASNLDFVHVFGPSILARQDVYESQFGTMDTK